MTQGCWWPGVEEAAAIAIRRSVALILGAGVAWI
jgi:hypothetical protein